MTEILEVIMKKLCLLAFLTIAAFQVVAIPPPPAEKLGTGIGIESPEVFVEDGQFPWRGKLIQQLDNAYVELTEAYKDKVETFELDEETSLALHEAFEQINDLRDKADRMVEEANFEQDSRFIEDGQELLREMNDLKEKINSLY